jgi:hypothetical protein
MWWETDEIGRGQRKYLPMWAIGRESHIRQILKCCVKLKTSGKLKMYLNSLINPTQF